MATKQGDLSLLNDPVAQELLQSRIPARLAYVWPDGTPRVVPVWFHWNGKEVIIGSLPGIPKLKALQENPHVALTIDTETFPAQALMIRGTATVEMVPQVPEYAAAAERYIGTEGAAAWMGQVGGLFTEMARIVVTPTWVGILDFETRFPGVIEDAVAAQQMET